MKPEPPSAGHLGVGRPGHEHWWNAPNLITLSRMILAPFVIREIVARRPMAAVILLFIAGMTDLLDGWVARATGSGTAVGELIDPVADKVLLSGVFLGLVWVGEVPEWFVILVFGRDILLLIASTVVMRFTTYSDLKPSRLGKASTLLQICTAGIVVGGRALGNTFIQDLGAFLVWPAAALTAASGIQYAARGLRYFARVDDRS